MSKTPSTVLLSLMDEYQFNPFSLSKALKLNPTTVRQFVLGKSKITISTALRLAKLFGQPQAFWLDLQRDADLIEAGKDKKLQTILKGISKAVKPYVKAKKTVPVKRKTTLSDKRKKAAKVPGAKPVRRKR